jgi:uncharacterized membrane protein
MSGAVRTTVAADPWKTGFFAVAAALFLWVCWVDERFLFIPTDREWTHIADYKYVLLLHGLGGLVALTVGASQFSERLRTRRPALHRSLGKVYLGACAVGGPAAFYMQVRNSAPIFLPAALCHSTIWMLASAMAYWSIRRRKILAHRAWMMRSYAMCLIFITVRIPDAFPSIVLDEAASAVLELVQIVVMLVGVELILTVRELTGRSRPMRA